MCSQYYSLIRPLLRATLNLIFVYIRFILTIIPQKRCLMRMRLYTIHCIGYIQKRRLVRIMLARLYLRETLDVI